MDANQAWQSTLGQIQMEMPKASYDTWVRNAQLVSHENNLFTIGVPNAYARDWLEDRLTSTVSKMLSGMMNIAQKVNFIVWHGEEPSENAVAETRTSRPADEPLLMINTTLIPRYTFDTFVVGSSNQLAHAACMAVAERPAHAYNPLFLYGGVGLGKTHLLHAIGNVCHHKGLNVLYVSSEEFTNDFIHAIQKHTNAAFRERYRNTDVLMIDDIQFIANKEQTQEEFFHTFNTLYSQEKQIIISSDRPPKALVTLEERLRSRFEWGLIGDIQPPDLEMRIAILQAKAEQAGRTIQSNILEAIARQVQSNIRELEGALTRVLAFSDLTGQALTTEMVNSALADLLPHHRTVEPRQVIGVVANAFGVSIDQIIGHSRAREITTPRHIAMYLLRQEANVSLPQIGQQFGGRDHTTVMHACDKISDLIERDDRLRRQVLQIREQLYGQAAMVY